MTSATLSLHSDDSDETGEISLATGISSSVRSGAVVICSGAANRGVGGGLTLAVGGAGVLGNLKIWAGAGRRALIASANERVSFQGGRSRLREHFEKKTAVQRETYAAVASDDKGDAVKSLHAT